MVTAQAPVDKSFEMAQLWLSQCKSGDYTSADALYHTVFHTVSADKLGVTLQELAVFARTGALTRFFDTLVMLRGGGWNEMKARALWNGTHWDDPAIAIKPEELNTTEAELRKLCRR